MKVMCHVFGLILVMSILSFAQDDDDDEAPVGTVHTKDGVLAFSNLHNDYFTFELKVKNASAYQSHGTYFVKFDGKGIQFNVVSCSDFLSPEELKNKNDTSVLRKYMQFEVNYFEGNLKTHFDVKAEIKKCKNGRKFLVWSFNMPKRAGNVAKQLFFSTVIRSHVLAFNGILLKEADYKEFYKILEKAMNSLQLKETAIRPEALKDSLEDKD